MFIGLSIIFALIIALLGCGISRPDFGIKLPRRHFAGILSGALLLVWCGYEGCLMLEGNLAGYRKLVIVLVPIAIVMSWYFLDYLLARSLGGWLAMLANCLLHLGFVENCFARSLYSSVLFIWGCVGLILVACPWRLRMVYEALPLQHPLLVKIVSFIVFFSALVVISLPLF